MCYEDAPNLKLAYEQLFGEWQTMFSLEGGAMDLKLDVNRCLRSTCSCLFFLSIVSENSCFSKKYLLFISIKNVIPLKKLHGLIANCILPLIYCCFSFGVNGRDSSLLPTLRAVRRLPPPYPPRLLCFTTFLRRLIAFDFFAFKLKHLV